MAGILLTFSYSSSLYTKSAESCPQRFFFLFLLFRPFSTLRAIRTRRRRIQYIYTCGFGFLYTTPRRRRRKTVSLTHTGVVEPNDEQAAGIQQTEKNSFSRFYFSKKCDTWRQTKCRAPPVVRQPFLCLFVLLFCFCSLLSFLGTTSTYHHHLII